MATTDNTTDNTSATTENEVVEAIEPVPPFFSVIMYHPSPLFVVIVNTPVASVKSLTALSNSVAEVAATAVTAFTHEGWTYVVTATPVAKVMVGLMRLAAKATPLPVYSIVARAQAGLSVTAAPVSSFRLMAVMATKAFLVKETV